MAIFERRGYLIRLGDILPFRVALLRVGLAGLEEAIDLAALVNGISVIGRASDGSDSSSLEAMVGWLLKKLYWWLAFFWNFSPLATKNTPRVIKYTRKDRPPEQSVGYIVQTVHPTFGLVYGRSRI